MKTILTILILATATASSQNPPQRWNCVPTADKKGWDCKDGPPDQQLDMVKKPHKGFIRGILKPTYDKGIKPVGKAIKKVMY